MPHWIDKPSQFTPEEYEKHVKEVIALSGVDLDGFEISHRETLSGVDGDYEMDVVARFIALKTKFTVLIECKHYKNPIKREIVQILCDKLQSTGSQKGMIFTTSSFQSGAITYAKQHGIALVKLTDSEPQIFNRVEKGAVDVPLVVGGWLIGCTDSGNRWHSRLGIYEPRTLLEALHIKPEQNEQDRPLIRIQF